MEVNDELINKLANLSRLQFSDEEKEEIRNDLEKMIRFIDKLNELDTTGIAPLLHMSDEVNVLRDDIVKGSISTTDALKNAPHHNEQYFLVPKMMRQNQ